MRKTAIGLFAAGLVLLLYGCFFEPIKTFCNDELILGAGAAIAASYLGQRLRKREGRAEVLHHPLITLGWLITLVAACLQMALRGTPQVEGYHWAQRAVLLCFAALSGTTLLRNSRAEDAIAAQKR